MEITVALISALQEAFLVLYNFSLPKKACRLQVTPKAFKGHFFFPVFPYSKSCREPANVLAAKVGQWLQAHTHIVAAYHAVGGFLNIVISDKVLCTTLKAMIQDPHYGRLAKKNQHVVVEFSSPNTNKPQHLGHLRNNFLGSALANILHAAGYKVDKVNLINDRGIHICKSMVAYEQFGHGETPVSSGIKGDHFVGSYYVQFEKAHKTQLLLMADKGDDTHAVTTPIWQQAQKMLVSWEERDPDVVALWKRMNAWVYEGFNQTYQQLGITFDKIYYESDTYLLGKSIVEEGLCKKIFYQKEDGTVAVDLSAYGLGEKIVLRGDGTSVYITQDLGTADLRYTDYHFDKMIYVVGNEQVYHFKVLFAIMELLGRPYATAMYHLAYGMVELPDGKMKSREGNVVDADHLVAEMVDTIRHYTENSYKLMEMPEEALQVLYHQLAIGALKFFLLRVTPQKNILFNPLESIDFQGDTGTCIQYTYARICSLERKAAGKPMVVGEDWLGPLNQLEQELILQLYGLRAAVEEAAKNYMPSVIANYGLTLAKTYNKFYASYPILKEPNSSLSSFRLLLSFCVGRALQNSMELLTITLPERM